MLLDLIRRLLRRMPKPPKARGAPSAFARAIEMQNAGDWQSAEALMRDVLARDPGECDARHLLASNLMQQGRNAEAVDLLREVTQRQPAAMEGFFNLGTAFSALGRHQQAAECFGRAAALRPDFAEAHCALGNALAAAGRVDDAECAYHSAQRVRPDFAAAAHNLGNLYHRLGRSDEAIECYRRAVALQPSFVSAHSNYVYALNFSAQATPGSIFEAHVEWARRHAEPLTAAALPRATDPAPDRRLKVGYLSPNFRDHAVTYFFESVLACHDRSRIEAFCYSDARQADAYTARLKQASAAWRDCAALTDDALTALIAADRIDILVDLTGHTEGHRLLVFARRAAPLQLTWNGYANTTGLSAMDYRISDALADPPGMTEMLHTETLLRLPSVYMVFTPPADSPPVNALPAAESGRVTFGSFNALSKITPQVVALWSRILNAVPGSRLLMATVPEGRTRARLTAQFAAAGVGAERLEWHDRLPQAAFLALHHRADIALDPFPFCGTTTTCQSLWMGLPVVTLSGRTHVARVGTSLLTNAGMPELVAADENEYANIATRLAGDIAKLRELREGLRTKLLHSTLMDAARFTLELEAAYRMIWVDWCSRQHLQGRTQK
jgi:protein O-GlcNAc transferase